MWKKNKPTLEDDYKLKELVLNYCKLTAGIWVGGACGFAAPKDLSLEQQMVWQTIHNAVWGNFLGNLV
jgi:hypothetical protein